jgi:regulatory protein
LAAQAEQHAVDEDDVELAAALVLARRRRIGPFRVAAAGPETVRKELGIMARAGFAQEIASTALRMAADEAEVMMNRLRRA